MLRIVNYYIIQFFIVLTFSYIIDSKCFLIIICYKSLAYNVLKMYKCDFISNIFTCIISKTTIGNTLV